MVFEAGYFFETAVYFDHTTGQNCLNLSEFTTKPNVNRLSVRHVIL